MNAGFEELPLLSPTGKLRLKCAGCGQITSGNAGLTYLVMQRDNEGRPVPNCPVCGLPPRR